jgi:hypothetical protein
MTVFETHNKPFGVVRKFRVLVLKFPSPVALLSTVAFDGSRVGQGGLMHRRRAPAPLSRSGFAGTHPHRCANRRHRRQPATMTQSCAQRTT